MMISTLNNQACSFANSSLSVITCTTFVGPTCSIAEIKISAMNLLYFTSSEQSSALKNITHVGDDGITLTKGLCFVSVHPS